MFNFESKKDEVVSNRINALIFVSCENGNINGDPDNGNTPRINNSTYLGVATDVSLKHHVREMLKRLGHSIMIVKDNASLNKATDAVLGGLGKNATDEEKIQALCKAYIDTRLFGGFCGKKFKAITGPVQIGMGKSVDKISVQELAINRCIPDELKPNKNGEIESNSQFANKAYTPYGLYKFVLSIDPAHAQKTGVTYGDVIDLFKAINDAYTQWSSAQKGNAETVKIVIFNHDSELGNAKMHTLDKLVTVTKKTDVPTCYGDYEITVDTANVPNGVAVEVIE